MGKTGYEISALSFGASSLGGVFHEIDEGKAIKAVHKSTRRRGLHTTGSALAEFRTPSIQSIHLFLEQADPVVNRDVYYLHFDD